MTSLNSIPAGYRELNKDEKILSSDLFRIDPYSPWVVRTGYYTSNVGLGYNSNGFSHCTTIRKIEVASYVPPSGYRVVEDNETLIEGDQWATNNQADGDLRSGSTVSYYLGKTPKKVREMGGMVDCTAVRKIAAPTAKVPAGYYQLNPEEVMKTGDVYISLNQRTNEAALTVGERVKDWTSTHWPIVVRKIGAPAKKHAPIPAGYEILADNVPVANGDLFLNEAGSYRGDQNPVFIGLGDKAGDVAAKYGAMFIIRKVETGPYKPTTPVPVGYRRLAREEVIIEGDRYLGVSGAIEALIFDFRGKPAGVLEDRAKGNPFGTYAGGVGAIRKVETIADVKAKLETAEKSLAAYKEANIKQAGLIEDYRQQLNKAARENTDLTATIKDFRSASKAFVAAADSL